MDVLEKRFQADLIRELKRLLPGCVVYKSDSQSVTGIPDITILYENKWALLECKKSEKAYRTRAQIHNVAKMNAMSFASFIYPENRKEVLDALQRSLRA